VINYRKFRNFDPPALKQVWNETFTGRGAARLPTTTPFECHILAKPYFDPEGLILAEQDGDIIGFIHAGFGPTADGSNVSTEKGVICALGVRPRFQRQGIGSELLRRGEEYLRGRGSVALFAGAHPPLNPFYFGLYGGCNSPGFLDSDPRAEPFFTKHGYQVCQQIKVLQRTLQKPVKVVDTRFNKIRDRHNIRLAPRKHLGPWWQECQFALAEPLEFLLEDKTTEQVMGRSRIWEMDLFSLRWNLPAIGISTFEVGVDMRRQGLGKYFLHHLLRFLQDQYYEIVEFHADQSATACLQLCQGLGFQQVDRGQVFKKV